MNSYHLRYNVYEDRASPVEIEKWVMFDNPQDDLTVRKHLEDEHKNTVSIILSKSICLEEYDLHRK